MLAINDTLNGLLRLFSRWWGHSQLVLRQYLEMMCFVGARETGEPPTSSGGV